VNIRLLKKLDAVIGYISASTFPAPARRNLASPVDSVLLIRPGGIGDAVLLAPAIHILKKIYPAIHVTVLAEQRNSGVFSLISCVDRLLCYDRPMDLLQVLRCSFDVVIDTEQWHRLSAVVARFAAAPVKIGFDTNERRRMFTHSIPYSYDDYEAVSFAHLLKPLWIEAGGVEMGIPFLSVPDAATEKTADLLELLHNETFVTIFPEKKIGVKKIGVRLKAPVKAGKG
jgi:ADP-heptose:LPS heptosyltransferase